MLGPDENKLVVAYVTIRPRTATAPLSRVPAIRSPKKQVGIGSQASGASHNALPNNVTGVTPRIAGTGAFAIRWDLECVPSSSLWPSGEEWAGARDVFDVSGPSFHE
jgi:hypothetical protein